MSYWKPRWRPAWVDGRWQLTMSAPPTVAVRPVRWWHPYDLFVHVWGYYERRRYW